MKLFFAGLIFFGVFQSTDVRASEERSAPPSQSLLRAYPGGRDESDLAVQPKRKVTRKNEDLDIEQFESESTETNSSQSAESFGE